ncbi:cellulose binding domain-containing protein [Actinorugispora endophytica]|uniref:Cellulose binding domain-containing protein n=1 Tax=Actinorugispora endophytica TaxID=1605990 RepID=A0A4R6VAK0_9ACTN|nr:cellulose binding domain-containing protein [Actinorugispora endophytica]TDQ53667.1 cellulose binding domain-containing protein [Actinorugispora endophytica]
MGRYGLGRGQRGAHRAESPDAGALATVGQVLGSTVPKRVPPPRPLRVLVLSGVIVGLVLFSYSTTQIYLRFAEPDHDASVPGEALASPTPEAPATERAPQPAASAGTEVTAEREDGDQVEDEGEGGSDGQEPVPEEAPGGAMVSYQTVTHGGENFMGTVTITNNSGSRIDGWELQLDFSDARVFTAWEADWEATAGGLVARQPSWAGGIEPGQSVTVNFTAQGSTRTPDGCSLNGRSCGLAP